MPVNITDKDEVFDDNLPAKGLYESLGFVKIGSRKVNKKDYNAMVHRRVRE